MLPEKKTSSNRYRKIECRMWGDEKFCSLSPLLPSGQALWIYLLTGPHTNQIPGLFRSGKAAMAENLGWTLEAFEEAFREAFQEGFGEGMAKACWKAKVVWVQNAIFCNKPASPNVITSWTSEWELIPECELKVEAYEFLESAMDGFGTAYLDSFRKACRKPSRKAFDKPSRKACRNQEQEQQQQQQQQQDQSQILLFNDGVVERQNVNVNAQECDSLMLLDSTTGELVHLDGYQYDMPRIEGKQPYTLFSQRGVLIIDEHVQNGSKSSKLVQKVQIEPKDSKFELFWKTYPRRQAKKKTHDIWKRKKLDLYIDIILEDLAQRTDWNSGSQFTPLPTTYLNGERWQDEEKNERKRKMEKSYIEELEEEERLQQIEKQKQMEEENEN